MKRKKRSLLKKMALLTFLLRATILHRTGFSLMMAFADQVMRYMNLI